MKWHFGCDEHNSAPAQVKACINVHKDIAFRSKDPEGVKCHEFLDVMGQLLVKLGVGAATAPTPLGGHVIAPTADWRQQVVDQDALLARKDAESAAQAKDLQLLRTSVARSEYGHAQTNSYNLRCRRVA